MNTPLDDLIAREQAKIDLLRSKISECERNIVTLKAMQRADDDLDAALARRVGNQRAEVIHLRSEHQSLQAGHDPVQRTPEAPKKALGDSALKLLRFAGTTDKSIDQFLQFAVEQGIDKNRQSMRAFLHQYKSAYGLLTSDRAGAFRLSDEGVRYLASLDQGGATSAT